MANKKSFKAIVQETTSPASAFISKPIDKFAQTNCKSEKKTVRVNLLFRASTKQNMEKLAYISHTSLNNFINNVLEEYIGTHSDDIAKYDNFFND